MMAGMTSLRTLMLQQQRQQLQPGQRQQLLRDPGGHSAHGQRGRERQDRQQVLAQAALLLGASLVVA